MRLMDMNRWEGCLFDETGCKHLYSGTGQEGLHLLSISKIVNPYQSLYIILICQFEICYWKL